MKMHKTKAGTELPISNIKGKDYLEVKYRIVWFLEERPKFSIETEPVQVTTTSAFFKATVRDEAGRIAATGHKFEDKSGFPDFIEKAETGAIGRALILLGYGTQFCADELDEGERIVDSPTSIRRNDAFNSKFPREKGAPKSAKTQLAEAKPSGDPGDHMFPFKKEFGGKRIKEIPLEGLERWVRWFEEKAEKPLQPAALNFVANAKAYLAEVEEPSFHADEEFPE